MGNNLLNLSLPSQSGYYSNNDNNDNLGPNINYINKRSSSTPKKTRISPIGDFNFNDKSHQKGNSKTYNSTRKFSAPLYETPQSFSLFPIKINDELKVVFNPRNKSYSFDVSEKYVQEIKLECSIPIGKLKKISQNDYELNFYRNEKEIRNTYIAKLIYKNIWRPSSKPKPNHNIFIFDWDDTLLCTSFITSSFFKSKLSSLKRREREQFSKLEEIIIKLLNKCLDKGDVYIITNSEPGWVEYSASKYYPNLQGLLQKVNIISARGKYEQAFPNNMKMWKCKTFLDIMNHFNNKLIINIICLGDSAIDIKAGNLLASKLEKSFVKTIKFREAPIPEELIKQLSLINEQFNNIYSSVKNLTINVERKRRRKNKH